MRWYPLNLFIVSPMHFRKQTDFVYAVLLVCALLLSPLVAWASDDPTERIYDAPFEKVWTVCVQTANERWKVTHTDQANGKLEFRQGVSFKTNSWGMNVHVAVTKVDESQTKVSLTFEKIDPLELSWAAKDIARSSLLHWTTHFPLHRLKLAIQSRPVLRSPLADSQHLRGGRVELQSLQCADFARTRTKPRCREKPGHPFDSLSDGL
jgi:hypothetical protein